MRARLRYLHYVIVNSFWFIPGLMLIASIALGLLSAVLDRALQSRWSDDLSWMLWVGPDGARTILEVIASSMIGATSLVFSMTLVTLTLASSQLGPRLLAIFRGDRMTQVALGVFVATLAYALLMLRLVPPETQGGEAFVPLAAVTVAQLMTLISLAVLIYFIHHLAQLLEADTIVSHVGRALDGSVDRLFPRTGHPDRGTEHDGAEETEQDGEVAPDADDDRDRDDRFVMVVKTRRSGYVQTVAQSSLVSLAAEAGGRIDLLIMAGDFLVAGQTMARFHPLDNATDQLKQDIRDCVTIGPKRTQAEDLEYAVNALVEIALRALSPSLNDPFTAIACINRIGSALALAINRRDPPLVHRDEAGEIRLHLPARGFIEVLHGGFDDIRRAAVEHPPVLREMVKRLTALADLAADPERRRAIESQAEAIRRAVEANLGEPRDRARVERELDGLDRRLRRWKREQEGA